MHSEIVTKEQTESFLKRIQNAQKDLQLLTQMYYDIMESYNSGDLSENVYHSELLDLRDRFSKLKEDQITNVSFMETINNERSEGRRRSYRSELIMELVNGNRKEYDKMSMHKAEIVAQSLDEYKQFLTEQSLYKGALVKIKQVISRATDRDYSIAGRIRKIETSRKVPESV